jgi:Mn2+/Fe2+ NRAMP family transporter
LLLGKALPLQEQQENHYGRLFESKNSAMGSSHYYRLIAIVPAVIVIIFWRRVTGKLLIFSQVILSLQLGFAVIPLIHFVSDKTKMNGFHISKVTQVASWIVL